ncbi:MAG: sigma-70 family RNA polymerase sigma factor [Verrucomicrobiales bacterium]
MKTLTHTQAQDTDEIRAMVRFHYSRIAESEGCGCAPSCCTPGAPAHETAHASQEIGYTAAQVAAVPAGANLGLGCGNPLAIADHYRQLRPTEPLDEKRLAAESVEPVRTEGEREALLAAFRRLITQLPDPYREAIELTELHGLSQSELAQRLGISLSGAKSRVQRGRAHLKEALLACCRLEFDRRGGVVECQAKSAGDCPECA